MRTIGRGLQHLALILLPVAIVLELTGGLRRSFGVADMLKMLIFSIVAFLLGRLIEGYAAGSQET
jgi:high-affinity K+ transport system ATPase subunit B